MEDPYCYPILSSIIFTRGRAWRSGLLISKRINIDVVSIEELSPSAPAKTGPMYLAERNRAVLGIGGLTLLEPDKQPPHGQQLVGWVKALWVVSKHISSVSAPTASAISYSAPAVVNKIWSVARKSMFPLVRRQWFVQVRNLPDVTAFVYTTVLSLEPCSLTSESRLASHFVRASSDLGMLPAACCPSIVAHDTNLSCPILRILSLAVVVMQMPVQFLVPIARSTQDMNPFLV